MRRKKQSPSAEPAPVTAAGQDTTIDPGTPSADDDLGYPGLGYGAQPPEAQLLTFTEMLPATRAFYRKS